MSNQPTTKRILGSFDVSRMHGQTNTAILNKPVKIESGEQFVPIYLAASLPLTQKNASGIGYTNAGEKSIPKEFIELEGTLTDQVKEWLYQDIKEYTVPVHTGSLSSSYAKETFLRNRIYSLGTECGVSLFGFHGNRSYLSTRYVRSKYYKHLINSNKELKTVQPRAVVVVKAKHLKQIRLGLFLDQPSKVTIPYSDIKLLIHNDFRLADYGIIADFVFEKVYCDQTTLDNLVGLSSTDTTLPTIQERLEQVRQLHNQPTEVTA